MNDDVARAKARELLEMVIREKPTEEIRQTILEHFLPAFQQRMREHYEKHGEWPYFYKNPDDWAVTTDLAINEEVELEKDLNPDPDSPH